MIIFGTRVRHKVIGEGQFFCPRCQARRAYVHKQASRYFALYFIPVFPMGQLGEFVECATCGTAFELGVLQLKAAPRSRSGPNDLSRLINSLGDRLSGGTPAEYLVRDLTAAGLDPDIAQDLVGKQLTNGRRECRACGLTFAPTVTACAECGNPLS